MVQQLHMDIEHYGQHRRTLRFTLGDRLRKARECAHISQEQMAHEFDVSPSSISNWESGRGYPRGNQLGIYNRWAELTDVDTDWITHDAA